METLKNGPTLGRSKWVVISEFGGGRFAARSVNSRSTTRLGRRRQGVGGQLAFVDRKFENVLKCRGIFGGNRRILADFVFLNNF